LPERETRNSLGRRLFITKECAPSGSSGKETPGLGAEKSSKKRGWWRQEGKGRRGVGAEGSKRCWWGVKKGEQGEKAG